MLGGLLLVLAVLAYLAGWERGRVEGASRPPWLAAVAGLFVASVLARATGLVLPALLLLLDVYPLRRIPRVPGAGGVGTGACWRRSSGCRPWVRSRSPWASWRAAAARTLAGRVRPAAWPGLERLQRRLLRVEDPVAVEPGPIYVMPSEATCGGPWRSPRRRSAASPSSRSPSGERWPAALAAWIAYAVLLVPVSGLVPFGRLLGVVDRYSYAASIGWAIAAGGAVAVAWEGWAAVGGRAGGRGDGRRLLGSCWVERAHVAPGPGLARFRSLVDARRRRVARVRALPVNFANWLAGAGRGEEALAHYEQALAWRREWSRCTRTWGSAGPARPPRRGDSPLRAGAGALP